jgi:hypothetical protein
MGGSSVLDEEPKPYHFQCSRIRYKLRSKPADLRMPVDLRIMHL